MNIYNNHNYGDNYTLQAGATVVARSGLEEALARERIYDELERQAEQQGDDAGRVAGDAEAQESAQGPASRPVHGQESASGSGCRNVAAEIQGGKDKDSLRTDEDREMSGAYSQLFRQESGLSVCLHPCPDESEGREVWSAICGDYQ